MSRFLPEEEEEEVAEEAPNKMVDKEVAEDKMPSKVLRRLKRISQLYEWVLGYNNQGLRRLCSLAVHDKQQLKDISS